MAVITKYPQIVSQSDFDVGSWSNLNNIKAYDGNYAIFEAAATGRIPETITARDFGFNIKPNAKINSLRLEWRDMVRNLTGGKTSLPNTGVESIQVNKAVQYDINSKMSSVQTIRGKNVSMSDYRPTPAQLNSDYFDIITEFKQVKTNPGRVYLDFLCRITVDYTDPTYALQATATSNVVGKQVTYTLKLRNTNSCHQGVDIPVSITLPAGTSYASQSGNNGTYDPGMSRWTAKLNSQREATITLVLNTSTVGNKTITALVQGFGTSLSRNFTVRSPSYVISTERINDVVEAEQLTYTVSVSTDDGRASPASVTVQVPIPAGLSYVSDSGGGSYNSGTGVWTASFTDQVSTKTFVFEALTAGSYHIAISTTGYLTTKIINIIPANVTEPYVVEHAFTDEVLDYLENGEVYILSGIVKVNDILLDYVYPGTKNFTFSVVNGNEYRSGKPSEFNTDTRVSAIFVYDSSQPIKFRVYGQWLEVNPENAEIEVGGLVLIDLQGVVDISEVVEGIS